MRKTSRLFAVLILLFVVVLFSIINSQQIEVDFLVTQLNLPLVIVIIGAVFIGALIVAIVMTSGMWQKNRKIKELEQKVSGYETNMAERVQSEVSGQVGELEERLKEKELELSDLKHQMVNQMMTESSEEIDTIDNVY